MRTQEERGQHQHLHTHTLLHINTQQIKAKLFAHSTFCPVQRLTLSCFLAYFYDDTWYCGHTKIAVAIYIKVQIIFSTFERYLNMYWEKICLWLSSWDTIGSVLSLVLCALPGNVCKSAWLCVWSSVWAQHGVHLEKTWDTLQHGQKQLVFTGDRFKARVQHKNFWWHDSLSTTMHALFTLL